MREMKDLSLSQELCGGTWKNHPGSAHPGGGGMGTDDTTLIERVELSSFGAAGDRLPVHHQQFETWCMSWRYLDTSQSSNVLVGGARTTEERHDFREKKGKT